MAGASQESQEERFGHHKQNFTHSTSDNNFWHIVVTIKQPPDPVACVLSFMHWESLHFVNSLVLKLPSYILEVI